MIKFLDIFIIHTIRSKINMDKISKDYKSLIKDTSNFLKDFEFLVVDDKDIPFFKCEPEKKEKIKDKKQDEPPAKTSLPIPICSTLPSAQNIKISLKKTKKNVEKASLECENEFIKTEKQEKKEPLFDEMKDMLLSITPSIQIIQKIPDDTQAKKIASYWKMKKEITNIVILTFKESPKEIMFLKNLAFAIDSLYMRAKVISSTNLELSNKWDIFLSQKDLKLILACDYSIWKLKNLIKYYKESPSSKNHFLKDTPLFLLPEISVYLNEPLLKKSLWFSLLKKINSFEKK